MIHSMLSTMKHDIKK